MIGNAVSRRYASALFSLGKEKGELDAFSESLTAFASAIEESTQLKELIINPVITHDEKKSVVMGVLGACRAGTTEKNFFSLLADKGRLALIPAIIADFKAMLDEVKGISRELVLSYAVDPQILGGIVLKVGDIVYDASLRAQLDNLRESIKRGE